MNTHTILLAGGKGTRMLSKKAKVLQVLAGKSFLEHTLSSAKEISDRVSIIVGFDKESIIENTNTFGLDISTCEQPKPKGTGDAVMCGIDEVKSESKVLVLYGDVPLIQKETLVNLINSCEDGLSILNFAEHLDKIMKFKIPLLCANPDYLVHNKNTLSMCGGTVAELYSDLGGTVFRYGKPYEPIYQDIFKKMRITNLSKVLVIGDSLWHDIAGGKKMKLDSLWIKCGIHKSKLKKKDEINPLLEKYRPKYVISHLKL